MEKWRIKNKWFILGAYLHLRKKRKNNNILIASFPNVQFWKYNVWHTIGINIIWKDKSIIKSGASKNNTEFWLNLANSFDNIQER